MWELFCFQHGIPAILANFLWGADGGIFLLTMKHYFATLVSKGRNSETLRWLAGRPQLARGGARNLSISPASANASPIGD